MLFVKKQLREASPDCRRCQQQHSGASGRIILTDFSPKASLSRNLFGLGGLRHQRAKLCEAGAGGRINVAARTAGGIVRIQKRIVRKSTPRHCRSPSRPRVARDRARPAMALRLRCCRDTGRAEASAEAIRTEIVSMDTWAVPCLSVPTLRLSSCSGALTRRSKANRGRVFDEMQVAVALVLSPSARSLFREVQTLTEPTTRPLCEDGQEVILPVASTTIEPSRLEDLYETIVWGEPRYLLIRASFF